MKPEGKIKRFLRRIFRSALVEGAIRSVPYGDVVYNIADKIKQHKEQNNVTATDWLKIVVTILCLAGIIYSLITKQITIDEFIKLLKSFL